MVAGTDSLIRPIEVGDLDRIWAINEANVPEVGSVDSSRLAFLLAESPIALASELDGEVVGFCLVMASTSVYDSVNYRWFVDRFDDFMYLDRVAFDERARGRGFGTALYSEVDRRMAGLGVGRLALEVNVDPPNEPSLAFHRGRGFVEVGQQDTPYGIRVSLQMRPVTRFPETGSRRPGLAEPGWFPETRARGTGVVPGDPGSG